MLHFDVNYIAVVVADVIVFFLGFAWYSNAMFGKTWRKLVGMNDAAPDAVAKMKKSMMPGILSSLLGGFLMSFVLVNVLVWSEAVEIMDALLVAFILWFALIAPVGLVNTIYGQKSMKLFYIDYAYQLLSLLIAAAILTYWM